MLKKNFIKNFRKKQGQVVIEYILLLVVVVTVAMAMLALVRVGDPTTNDGGSLIQYWKKVIQAIGNDV